MEVYWSSTKAAKLIETLCESAIVCGQDMCETLGEDNQDLVASLITYSLRSTTENILSEYQMTQNQMKGMIAGLVVRLVVASLPSNADIAE